MTTSHPQPFPSRSSAPGGARLRVHLAVLLLSLALGASASRLRAAPGQLGQASAPPAESTSHFLLLLHPVRPGFPTDMTPAEQKVFEQHVENVRRKVATARFLLAAARQDAAFGLAILEAMTYEEARQIAESDPAVEAGILRWELYPLTPPLQSCLQRDP